MKKRCVSLILVIIMVVSFASPVFAKQDDSFGQNLRFEQKHNKAIEMLEPYLSLSESGNILLDAPKSVVKKIDLEIYQSLLTGLRYTNIMIDKGFLQSNQLFEISITEKYLETSSQLRSDGGNALYVVDEPSEVHILSSGNEQKIEWYWWGFKIWLNNTTCNRIVSGLTFAEAIALFIPDQHFVR